MSLNLLFLKIRSCFRSYLREKKIFQTIFFQYRLPEMTRQNLKLKQRLITPNLNKVLKKKKKSQSRKPFQYKNNSNFFIIFYPKDPTFIAFTGSMIAESLQLA